MHAISSLVPCERHPVSVEMILTRTLRADSSFKSQWYAANPAPGPRLLTRHMPYATLPPLAQPGCTVAMITQKALAIGSAIRAASSMVEQVTLNHPVPGSSPGRLTIPCLPPGGDLFRPGEVSELADEHDLGSCAARRRSSSLLFPTTSQLANSRSIQRHGVVPKRMKGE
jgi:hypothetical protein